MYTTDQPRKRERRRQSLTALALLAALGGLFWAGCTAKHYREKADEDVYRIVQQVEAKVFGQTNQFTIDTPYSNRRPDEILPAELVENRLQSNRRNLTIEAALDLAVNNSRRYQTEKERLYLQALTLTGARYAFEPHFFANLAGTFRRGSAQDRHDLSFDGSGQVGVSQLLKSGGRLSLNLANDVLRYFTGDPRRSVVTLASMNFTQPLLRGFGRNSPEVELLTQAERNVFYAMRSYGHFQDEFALEIINDYFTLLAQKDNTRNRYTNYLNRIADTKRLEARSKDREALSDVDQSRQAELTAKNNYINSMAAYRNALDQFKIKLGLPINEHVTLDDQALAEVEQNGLVPADMNPEAAYRIAVERHLLILNSIDQFEDVKRQIRIAINGFLPDLDLSANASLESDRPTAYTRFDPDDIRADVGLVLDLPIDRLRERNEYRRTLVTFEAELRNLTLTFDTLKDNIERGLRTLEQRRQNYYIQKNALTLANRRVASNSLLLQAGRAEVRDLVEARDEQIQAQNALTLALVDYQESRLQLMLDIGALQTEQDKFWLKDHLAGYLQPHQQPPVTEAAAQTEQPVLPPEEYFNN